MNNTSKYTNGIDLVLVNSPLKNYDRKPRFNDFTLPTLGLGYIATCVAVSGYSVEVIDTESLGLGISEAARRVDALKPRWVGLNLLAPTYRNSVEFLRLIDPDIQIMLGGHQAKAMPMEILRDTHIPRIDALILGEAETRVPILLSDVNSRQILPQVYWRENGLTVTPNVRSNDPTLLAPDINKMPFLDRRYLDNDPYNDNGVLKSAMVASRGCPFDCSFCGAAVSANPDITIRMRRPDNLLDEISELSSTYGVRRIRFVDDLFLANRKVMRETLSAFVDRGSPFEWDATGRINILAGASNDLIDLMRASGCREVALGIESGSDRMLSYIDKKISVAQIMTAVERLCRAGINVKGYFILGLPTETVQEHQETLRLIDRLRSITADLAGSFRCSAFEYRPYPGTPDWARLIAAGYDPTAMLQYESDSLDNSNSLIFSPDRDEFNFSTGIQFGEVSIADIRNSLIDIMRK